MLEAVLRECEARSKQLPIIASVNNKQIKRQRKVVDPMRRETGKRNALKNTMVPATLGRV